MKQDIEYAVPLFKAGAEWRINSVWHDAREKPDKGKLLIVGDIDGAYDLVYLTKSKPWEELSEKDHYMRWAYIEDLLPCEKEGGVIMNKKLRNAIKKAENKQNEADLALQSIWEHLAFSGFRDNEPNLSMASGNEIILEWNGSEMNANEIIDRMESVGYITPDDFIGG